MRIHAFHHLYQQRLSQSTKPFVARGAKVIRCQFCQVAKKHCICHQQPDIDCDIAALLLVSKNEVFKPSNTGRLIADTIKQTYVYQWKRTEPDSDMLALLNNTRYQPVVVFPKQYVENEKRVVAAPHSWRNSDKTPLLVLIDGSWREARKIFRRSEYLADLPVISIAPERVSQYVMRKSADEQHLATAEVATLVLEELGETNTALSLSAWFELFRESYLLSKTQRQR
ncbi:tRNA-uridine aminocarboxypropyltransferase [Vibrio sp.]|uniref:tRNA-uridine aminocarboxypropyltransferase n=1 Tax=Vibrio sp. TaxID=678 RepID=UPI003D0EE458